MQIAIASGHLIWGGRTKPGKLSCPMQKAGPENRDSYITLLHWQARHRPSKFNDVRPLSIGNHVTIVIFWKAKTECENVPGIWRNVFRFVGLLGFGFCNDILVNQFSLSHIRWWVGHLAHALRSDSGRCNKRDTQQGPRDKDVGQQDV